MEHRRRPPRAPDAKTTAAGRHDDSAETAPAVPPVESPGEVARQARARAIHEQIEGLVSDDRNAVETKPSTPEKESPRDFVHRKMRELKDLEGESEE